MSPHELETALRAQVSESVCLAPDSEGRHYIVTPFTFGDGDGPVILLHKNGPGWTLTDQGNTMMRLSCRLNDSELKDPERLRKIDGAMKLGSVVESEGELIRHIDGTNYAEALFDFVHALLRIDELGYPDQPYSKNGAPLVANEEHAMSAREFRGGD